MIDHDGLVRYCCAVARSLGARDVDSIGADVSGSVGMLVRQSETCAVYWRRIVRQTTIKAVAREKSRDARTVSLSRTVDIVDNRERDAETHETARETRKTVSRVISGLGPVETAIAQGLRSGRSRSDIGARLGITRQAVEKRMKTIGQKLRRAGL